MNSENKFNIVNLIEKNSITRLNKDYESKLVNKIKTVFTNKEQQIFLASFYCYLKYDSNKDFVIAFDNVWKWCGFTRKDHAKTLLEKYFTKDTDYKIYYNNMTENNTKTTVDKLAPANSGASLSNCVTDNSLLSNQKDEVISKLPLTEEYKKLCKSNKKTLVEICRNKELKISGTKDEIIKRILGYDEKDKNEQIHGGQNKEKIMLNVNTFKKFCLKAQTEKADEIHNYYIKLESVLQETINEQTGELQNQLLNKETKLLSKQKEIESIKEENVTLKKKMYERQRHRYTEGSSVYIIMNNDIEGKFKFGKTNNINNRLTQLNSGAPSQYYVHKIWYTRMAKKTERIVHDIFGKYRISKDCEWFENKTLDNVIEFVDKLISLYQQYDTVKVIKKEETLHHAKLVFIDENPKQCKKCLLYKKVTDFNLQDISLEEPKVFSSEEEKQDFYIKKYRSICKECSKKTNKERKKLLKYNPNVGKQICVNCKELLEYKCFFDGNNECINCYKDVNNIKEYCKQCNKCKKVLFSKDFHSDINKTDGLHTICKNCRNENLKGARKSEDIECKYCKKIIKGSHNLPNHQKTLSCLEFQGKEIERKNKTGNSKKIYQINKNTLEVIKEFDSLKIATSELNISQKKIYKILKNEIEYDYKLKYA